MSGRNGAGGPPPTALVMAVVESLEGKGWRLVDDVVREVSKTIPPGRAIRATENVRRSTAGAPETRQRPASHERLIAQGRRTLVRGVLKTGHFQTRMAGDFLEARMVSLPSRVALYRRLEAEGKAVIDPRAFADRLVARGTNRKAMLDGLSHTQLVRVTEALAEMLEVVR